MTLRHVLHSVGTFPICPACGDEYRHIVDSREGLGGHCLSCCCGDSPKFPTFDALLDAMQGWCLAHGVIVPDAVAVHLLAERWPMLVQGGDACTGQ